LYGIGLECQNEIGLCLFAGEECETKDGTEGDRKGEKQGDKAAESDKAQGAMIRGTGRTEVNEKTRT